MGPPNEKKARKLSQPSREVSNAADILVTSGSRPFRAQDTKGRTFRQRELPPLVSVRSALPEGEWELLKWEVER
jgi:hypothetical protein